MHDVQPAYFYGLGFFINSVNHLRDDVPIDLRITITNAAWQGVRMFLADQDLVKALLPKSYAKAIPLEQELQKWATEVYVDRSVRSYADLRRLVESFSTTLTDELGATHNYVVTDKGNLSVDRLIEGASKQYPQRVKDLIGTIIQKEIDDAGKCLAYAMFTACGFHILRSVEMAIEGYLLTTKHTLPPQPNRSWSTYLKELRSVPAHTDVLDIITVLNRKRNPLMHPEDTLDLSDALQLFCLCEAAITSLMDDIDRKSLGSQFTASLVNLPAAIATARAVVVP